MIKVGIIGAETPDAGELLRILIHHPEVDIKTLYAPAFSSRPVASCHHGFIGENVPNLTDRIDPSELDIIYIADDSTEGENILMNLEKWPDLRVVDMSKNRFTNRKAYGLDYGLSEVNRKTLVRGSRLAIVPSAPAALALISLYPLAASSLLDSDIDVSVVVPEEMAKQIDAKDVSDEIISCLSISQPDFSTKINVKIIPADLSRAIIVKAGMKSGLLISEVSDAFDSVYDDHNFVFTSLSEVGSAEVEGTHKCVVSLSKPAADTLELETVGDSRMRGGAGDAVHVLNLFFALDEKVGLELKPAVYGKDGSDASHQTSWFA